MTDAPPRFVTARDGVRIAYAVHGSGPPLVFVRGWISHLTLLWADARFRSYMEALGRHFRVIRFDTRGNGLSDRELQKLELDDLLLDLEAVIDGLSLGDVVLYGATFGGPIAMLYAARHPGAVRNLVLEGTFARGREITTKTRQVMITRSLKHFPEMAFALLGHVTHPEPHDVAYRHPEKLREMISGPAAAKLYGLAFATDISHELPKIRTPTLVLHQRESQSIPFRLGGEVASLIPGARLVALAGTAHNAWEGDPSTALQEIGNFLGVDLCGQVEELPLTRRSTIEVRYQLMDKIGEGGMGVVYRAEDRRLGREVAVKFLRSDLAHSVQARQRFEREVRAVSGLNHPNICSIHDVGDDEGIPFMVMEFLKGQTVREILRCGPIDFSTVLSSAIDIASALSAVHNTGLIHRDIKPSNLFLTHLGFVKVLDFGLAKLCSSQRDKEAISTQGVAVGTVDYMSPEQASGVELDARSDLFSVGVLLFEMSTGVRPFRGRTNSAVMRAILDAPTPSLHDYNPALPIAFETIVSKLLQKERTGSL